jgi:uncharacterized membrane protein
MDSNEDARDRFGADEQDGENELVVREGAMEAYSGPLPPPEILARFDAVVPGAAERILKMAEEQAAHRKDLERKLVESDIERSKWGQALGFLIAIAGLAASAAIAIYGSAVAGSILGVGTLASLVGVFMYGVKARSREREEKRDDDR